MTNSEISFLNEVASELVTRGITNPTFEQIVEAMKFRLTRQQEIVNKFFSDSKFHDVVTTGLAIEVYHNARKEADRKQWVASMREADRMDYIRSESQLITDSL